MHRETTTFPRPKIDGPAAERIGGGKLGDGQHRGSVLVTGAGGFVGSHLAEGLATLNYVVTALDISFDAVTRARLEGTHLVEMAITPASLSGLGRFDIILHAAALTTPPELLQITPAAHALRNTKPLLATLDFAIAGEASTFIFLSSSGVFEGSSADLLLESTPTCATTAYGVAKRIGETLLALAPEPLRCIAIRLGPIYGPYERSRQTSLAMSLVGQWLDAAASGLPIVVSSAQSCRDWTYAPDIARAIDAVLSHTSLAGVVHLCSPGTISDAALAQQIGRLTGAAVVESPRTGTPRRPMTSERLDLANLIDWTLVETGLARIHSRQVLA